jgi:L-fucose isomerase-like protein
MAETKVKVGFIPANRGFFSTKLAVNMRRETIAAMKAAGMRVVVPSTKMTEAGCVETLAEAKICAKLFRDENVDGILVGAVNFGDEQGVGLTVKMSGLDVPILIFGCQEESVLGPGVERRDSFCGLLSIGEALRQIGKKYTVASVPICFPSDASFASDLDRFARVCRVVTSVKSARFGVVGARPDAFWTCRYSEKMLQELGVTVVSLDLSEAIGAVGRMADNDRKVKRALASIQDCCDTSAILPEPLMKMAKFEVFLRDFVKQNQLDGLAIQCWTSIQENLGICSCGTMGRLGDDGIPCACESDILGTLSMFALAKASGGPATLADWNNLHNDDDELVNIWHCGVFPPSFAKSKPKMGVQEIIAGAVGAEKAMGVVEFVCKPGPVTLCRCTQGNDGSPRVFLAEGAFEDNPATTFGAYGWCRIPGIEYLYRDILCRYFPHHVGVTMDHVGDVLHEAFGNYLGMDVYIDNQSVPGAWQPGLPFAE